MNEHRLAEERSLAFHAEVAARLRAEPVRLEAIRARVAGWLEGGTVHPHYAGQWSQLLAGSLDEICTAIVERSERANALRQCTPFAGIVDPRTRWRIWREVRERLAGERAA